MLQLVAEHNTGYNGYRTQPRLKRLQTGALPPNYLHMPRKEVPLCSTP